MTGELDVKGCNSVTLLRFARRAIGAVFAMEAERAQRGHPVKPLRRIRDNGEHALIRGENDVGIIVAHLDQGVRTGATGRDRPPGQGRKRWFWRGYWSRTGGCGRGRSEVFARTLQDGEGKSSELGLQGEDLRLELDHLHTQGGEFCGHRRSGWLSGRVRGKIGGIRHVTLMQASHLCELGVGETLDAGIAGMQAGSTLGSREPATQGFGIDAQMETTIGKRNQGHDECSFPKTQNTSRERRVPGKLPGSLGKNPGNARC